MITHGHMMKAPCNTFCAYQTSHAQKSFRLNQGGIYITISENNSITLLSFPSSMERNSGARRTHSNTPFSYDFPGIFCPNKISPSSTHQSFRSAQARKLSPPAFKLRQHPQRQQSHEIAHTFLDSPRISFRPSL